MTPFHILFVGSVGSIYSPMACSIFRKQAGPNTIAHCAATNPAGSDYPETGGIHPMALETLRMNQCPTEGLTIISLDEFSKLDREIHLLIYLRRIDREGIEPAIPSKFSSAIFSIWNVEMPDLEGEEQVVRRSFFNLYNVIQRRVDLLVNIPFEALQGESLKERVDHIGQSYILIDEEE